MSAVEAVVLAAVGDGGVRRRAREKASQADMDDWGSLSRHGEAATLSIDD